MLILQQTLFETLDTCFPYHGFELIMGIGLVLILVWFCPRIVYKLALLAFPALLILWTVTNAVEFGHLNEEGDGYAIRGLPDDTLVCLAAAQREAEPNFLLGGFAYQYLRGSTLIAPPGSCNLEYIAKLGQVKDYRTEAYHFELSGAEARRFRRVICKGAGDPRSRLKCYLLKSTENRCGQDRVYYLFALGSEYFFVPTSRVAHLRRQR